LLDIPSIGEAEQLVYGTCDVPELPKARGSKLLVLDPEDGAVIGAAIRTHSGDRPIYVSVGFPGQRVIAQFGPALGL
jgi:deoxyinosine 3'endonuclease (endonuclease V)